MRRLLLLLTFLLSPLFAAPVLAAEDCPAEAALPAPYEHWRDAELDGAGEALAPGSAYRLALVPAEQAAFEAPPEREPTSGTYGAAVRLNVAQPGIYRIALDKAAWVDVVDQGSALVSTSHGHGPECSGIRKIVDFKLDAGDHVIQLSGNADDALRMLVVRVGG